jgi:hypothetical protein
VVTRVTGLGALTVLVTAPADEVGA